VTTRGNPSSALTSLLVKLTFLDPKGKVDNRLPYFKGMCFCNLNPFGTECSSKFLRFPCATRGHVLPFGRFCPSIEALLEFLKSFSSKAFPLIRKGLLVFDWHCFDILFVGFCTTVCYYGPTVPPHFTNRGCQSFPKWHIRANYNVSTFKMADFNHSNRLSAGDAPLLIKLQLLVFTSACIIVERLK
jgi:hypothetical protein